MEKDRVIKLRDTLKAGKNWPLMVYIDNTFRIIDESNVLQFTKWDDENGFLYNYSITDANMNNGNNTTDTISVFATDYESIQSMELARIGLNDLGTSIDALGCISSEWKERIIERFKIALSPNRVNLSRTDINKAMGLVNGNKSIDDSVDYYAGRYPQPFAETRSKADHNAYAEKVAAEKANK